MNRNTLITGAALAALGMTTGLASAGDEKPAGPTLHIGDKAPTIDIAHWVKGLEVSKENEMTPITEFEKDKVYVLEFWATWCGPCKAGMPHLSELQERFKDYDVTVIGVSDEQLPTVVGFLFDTYAPDGKVQNERTNYVLATDPDESVKNDYFRAAGLRGIPSAFIIGKSGRIEWIGHPMNMDDALHAVVHDTWDRDSFAVEYETARKAEMKLQNAYREKDWDTVLGIFDAQLEEQPENLQLLMNKFNVLLLNANRPSEAYAIGEMLLEKGRDESALLNGLAWNVATDDRIQERNLDFALKAALRANDLTDAKDPAILDTLARVYYEQDEIWKAIKWQRKAAEVSGDDRMGEDIRKTLEKYEKEAKF